MLAKIEAGSSDEFIDAVLEARNRYKELFEQFQKVTEAEHKEVVTFRRPSRSRN